MATPGVMSIPWEEEEEEEAEEETEEGEEEEEAEAERMGIEHLSQPGCA